MVSMDTSIKHGILEGTNEGSTAYICVLCGKGQSSLGELEKHMMNHNRTSQALENAESLTYSQTETEKDENAGNLCASFQTKSYDKENIGVCNIMKRYGTKSESKVLQENFKNNRMLGSYSSTKKKWVEENLKENVKGHTSIHYCTVCNKGFTEKRNLMYHYRTHQEEKQYKCEYCGKGFHFNFNLKKHIRIHTGETPYSCGVCQRGFRHKNSLNRHMLLHLDNNHLGNNHLDNNHLGNNHLGNNHLDNNHLGNNHHDNNHLDNNRCDNKELANKQCLQKCSVRENSENWTSTTEKENMQGLNSSSVCGVCLKVFNKRRGLSMHVYRQYKNVESAFCKLCDREINGGVVVHLMSHSFNTTEGLKGVQVSSEQRSTLPDHNKTNVIYSKTKLTSIDVPSPLRQLSKVGNQHGHKSVKHRNGKSRNSVEFTEQELCEKLKKQEDYKQQTTGSTNTVLKGQRMYSTSTDVPIIQTSKTVKTEIVTDGRYDMAAEFGGKTVQEGIKNHSLNKENTSSQSVLHQRDVTKPAMECRSTNDVFGPVQVVMETKGQILGSQTMQDNIKIEESLCNNDTRLSIDSVVSSNTSIAKIFKCPVCDRSFRFNSYLKSHMKVHSGEKPHTCPVCNKGFTHKFNLTKHLRTHTGETPYMCKLCGRQFSQKNSLNRHMLLHTKNSLYTCYLCGLKLCDKTTFEYHLLSHDQLGYNQIGGNKSIGEMSEMLKSGNSTSSTLCQKLSLGQRDSVLLKNNNSQMSGDVVSDKDLLLNEYQGHQIASGPKTKKSLMEYPNYASDKQGQRNTTVPKIVNSLIDYPISAFDKQSFSKKTTSLDYDKKVSFSGENRVREENKTVVFDVHHRDKNSNSNYYGQDFGMVSGQSEPLNLSLKRETRMDLDSNVTVYSGILNSFGKGSNQVDCHLKISSKHRIENIQESSFTDKVMKTMHNIMSDKFTKKSFNLRRKMFREKIGCNLNPCNISRPLTRIGARPCSPASQYFKRHKKSRKLSSPKNQQLKKKKSEYKLKIQSTQAKRVVFKCKYCFGTFNNGISLKYHNFDHLKEENFKCDQCKQTFRLFISLNIHIIAHHAN